MKVKDIFTTSIDCESKCEQVKLFYKAVQNKLHFSVHWRTSAELIVEHEDVSKDKAIITST